MSAQEIAESKCREVYSEAQTFFDRIKLPRNYGFKILYGPPLCSPPILFVGYQPGGGDDDFERETALGSDKHWPKECEYATESWKLAKEMRKVFGRKFLARCVGVNAIFLRAPNAREYKTAIDRGTRAQLESFCMDRVRRIVEAIDPHNIVVTGLGTLRLFGESEPDCSNETGQSLTSIGKIAGRPAIAMLHPSGARISNRDRVLRVVTSHSEETLLDNEQHPINP